MSVRERLPVTDSHVMLQSQFPSAVSHSRCADAGTVSSTLACCCWRKGVCWRIHVQGGMAVAAARGATVTACHGHGGGVTRC